MSYFVLENSLGPRPGVVEGPSEISVLLAAFALQHVHGVNGNRVSAYAVVFLVHNGLPLI